ncbi:hypothetical protein EDB92DRAFT_1205009 [Lactarius akahatsu]|uniref:Uncharacterized protein n=1 Tax=Lactarius akahatsu TaxID=416441 RepID=A0AAD4LFW9_9AGAM|nr:hypothetical protein EDB92DRAFT_1205009 [Lactarius akahatsu]
MVTQLNVEAPRHTPLALQIVFSGSSAPLRNRLFYSVANRCSMAHGSHDSSHPLILKTSTLLMVVLPPSLPLNDLPVYLLLVSRIFASPVCGLAWRKGRMRAIMLSGTKVRVTIWLDMSTAPCLFLWSSCQEAPTPPYTTVVITHMCSTPCSVLPFCSLKCMGSHTADQLSFALMRSLSTSLRAQALPGSAGHATCASSCHCGRRMPLESHTSLLVIDMASSHSPLFPRLCMLASLGKLAHLLQEEIPPSNIVVGSDLAGRDLMPYSFACWSGLSGAGGQKGMDPLQGTS